jgi:ElaB/YqjD/DUF883 family membrane-anchored ribosome-binding protein
MATVLESSVETVGTYLGTEGKAMMDRMDKVVDNAKAAVEETIEDSKIAAERLLKRGREAVVCTVEDGMQQAVRQVKRNPGRSLAVAFAVGAVVGMLAPKLTKRIAG